MREKTNTSKFIYHIIIILLLCRYIKGEVDYVYDNGGYFILEADSNLVCNSTMDVSSTYNYIMRGCFKDTRTYDFLGSAGAQLIEWFNQTLYFQYISSFLFFLPFVAFTEKMALETQAKANFWRLQLVLLLFRLGLAASSSAWLQAVFQQPRPCDCSFDGGEGRVLGSVFGMPAADMVVTTVLALHFFQYISKIFAVIILFSVAFEHVILGYTSVGQVLGGFVIGLVLHIYGVCSPIFMRIIDFIVNIIGGSLVFILVKGQYPDADFSFAVLFLNGIAWMLFSMCLFFLYYTFKIIKVIWNTPSHFVKDDIFVYYTPLTEGSLRSINFSPQRRFESVYFILLVILLFLILVVFRVFTPSINSLLNSI